MINNQNPELNPDPSLDTVNTTVSPAKRQKNQGKSLSLKIKTTLFAIAIGVIPTIATVGATCLLLYVLQSFSHQRN